MGELYPKTVMKYGIYPKKLTFKIASIKHKHPFFMSVKRIYSMSHKSNEHIRCLK